MPLDSRIHIATPIAGKGCKTVWANGTNLGLAGSNHENPAEAGKGTRGFCHGPAEKLF